LGTLYALHIFVHQFPVYFISIINGEHYFHGFDSIAVNRIAVPKHITLVSYTPGNEKHLMACHFPSGRKGSNMAIKRHLGRLIVSYTSTPITIQI